MLSSTAGNLQPTGRHPTPTSFYIFKTPNGVRFPKSIFCKHPGFPRKRPGSRSLFFASIQDSRERGLVPEVHFLQASRIPEIDAWFPKYSFCKDPEKLCSGGNCTPLSCCEVELDTYWPVVFRLQLHSIRTGSGQNSCFARFRFVAISSEFLGPRCVRADKKSSRRK